MDIIVKMYFGSKLYGTETPSSDTDFKGIYLPTREQILLNKIPKSVKFDTKTTKEKGVKNTSEDVDSEFYSLHYFIELALKGDTSVLDMLYAPDNMILKSSDTWNRIVKYKDKFLTKNIKSYVEYCKGQASKYGVKGSRLDDAMKVQKVLYEASISDMLDLTKTYTVETYWDRLPSGENIIKHPENNNGIKMYEVCNRKILANSKIDYALDMVNKIVDTYGARAKKARDAGGKDWRAISHAFRVAYQIKSLFQNGEIVFPLPERDFVKAVKSGELNFVDDNLGEKLDNLGDEIEELARNSNLPDVPDSEFWTKFLLDELEWKLFDKKIKEIV